MTTDTATPAAGDGLADDTLEQAIHLHGLIVAFSLIHDDGTMASRNARGALIGAMEALAERHIDAVERLTTAGRRSAA